MKKQFFLASCITTLVLSAADYKADVVVYGGSSGGVTAAIAAARNDKSVIIVEPSGHLGGMTANGLGQVDIFRPETLGGITAEYFARAANVPKGRIHWVTPAAAEQLFTEMAAEAGVRVITNARLQEKSAVKMDGKKIAGITLENGDTVGGKVFIDASYEGDLMAQAGISYRVGREGQTEYNESAAGVRPAIRLKYAEAYDQNGKLRFDLVEDEAGVVGSADGLTQAYNFRLCMTQDKNNMVAVKKPANYNPDDYRNLLLSIRNNPNGKQTFNDIISYWGLLSGGTKADINNRGDFSTDMINHSHSWAEASYAERGQIYQQHKDFIAGLIYFLANDPEVPENLRNDTASWGLAADEFIDNDNWPYLLYVREARRMVGDYVMNQKDAYADNTKPDSVGIGSYMLDSHAVRKFVNSKGEVYIEGFISVFDGKVPVRPYEIAYRSLVPKIEECENMLNVLCFSATHVMYSSLRMEPVFMTVGEAAGVAAAMAINAKLPVQKIDVPQLQQHLEKTGGIIHYPGGNLFPIDGEMEGIVIDNNDAKFSGRWARREVGVPMYNGGFFMADAHGEPSSVTFEWIAKADGEYAVSIIAPRIDGLASPLPVQIGINDNFKRYDVKLNNKGKVTDFVSNVKLKSGDKFNLIISNEGRKIKVAADAVQLIPIK